MKIEYIDYEPPSGIMNDRVVMVTGAGAGIGRAVAIALAKYGATVLLMGRTKAGLESVHDEILSENAPRPAILEADLERLTWDDYVAMAKMLEEEFGRLDGLLHNASILGDRSPIEHYDPMTWHRVMHINLGAQFLMTRALLPVLKSASDPSLLLTSSSVGRTGKAYWGAYAVSKFGTEGLMQVLSDEMEADQLRVNCINPGATKTAMRTAAFPGGDPKNPPPPETLVNNYLYLLGPASKGISGRTFDAQGSSPADR
ncbi:MAG: YciK family oxidoreductase [Gammaproteobacteria bacterium]|nr:YciK family oxidoreductase [Gammaproteobacteria bacterium]